MKRAGLVYDRERDNWCGEDPGRDLVLDIINEGGRMFLPDQPASGLQDVDAPD